MIEAEEFLRRGESNEAAGFEKGDARGEEKRFANIVRDEDNGFAEAACQRAEFALKLGAGDGIERAEWLVHEEDGRVGGEGARDFDALALDTGELAGTAFGNLLRIEADELEHFFDTRRDAGGVPFFQARNEADVSGDGEMRKKASLLDDVADAAAEADGVPGGCGPAIDQDLAKGGKQHPVDKAEKGGLSTAAAAE